MKHLELHIIQSVPVSCLNRDDFGSPKSAFFGGVQRARISSQCWKRAAREMMSELAPEYFRGERTRLVVKPLADALEDKGLSIEEAQKVALALATEIGGLSAKKKEGVAEGEPKLSTLFFTSPKEIQHIAALYMEQIEKQREKSAEKEKKSGAKVSKKESDPMKATVKGTVSALGRSSRVFEDAGDVALFGRMVASAPELGIEGAAMFNHALSTGRVSNEVDYFTAVDDLSPEGEAAAGMVGTQEFNSAVYYRFAAVNLSELFDSKHLGAATVDERRAILSAFVEAVVKSVPKARRNSMNANVLPSFVLGVVRDKGHPVQLVNAFEEPVKAQGGIVAGSVERMMAEYQRVKDAWGISAVSEASFDGKSGTFRAFLEKVVNDAID